MSLLTKKQAGIHENASTQINVPKDVADQIIAIGKELIPDEHLAGEGRITQPHITVKYGVQPQAELLQQALAGRTSFPVTLGSTVAFVAGSTGANAANNGTPVVIEVHGHELEALHEAVMQAMGTLPDDLPYVPHITVAYVKPDEAQHYVGNDAFTGLKFTAEAVALSPYDDSKQVDVPLAKAADLDEDDDIYDNPVEYFAHSACWIYALALHDLTGLPMVSISAPNDGVIHAAVQRGNKLLDSKGEFTLQQIGQRYGVKKPFTAPLTEEGVDKLFGIDEDELERAMSVAREQLTKLGIKTAASPAQVTPEIPQVTPQTPQQQPEEDEEVQRDQPATPPRQQRDTPATDPRPESAKPAPKKRQPKLLQPKAPKPPAKNPDFKKWFGKSKVTDAGGKPLVVYHGTTHDFTTFDPSKTTNDSFYGQGLYFTSSKKDLENYASDVGPDITRRVEFQSEKIVQEWEDSWDEVKDQLGMSKFEEFPPYGTYERDELNEKAKQEAKKEVAGGSGGMSMPVYLSLQNPVIVQKRGGTEFHIDMEEDESGEYTGEESGTGVDLYNAMMLVAGNFDSADAQDVWNDLIGNNGSDFTAYDFEQLVRNGNWEFTDSNGDMAAGSFIAQVYQELGFDGIIQDAYAEFGPRPSGYAGGKLPGMQMDQDTKHYILWDPSKIKSAMGNVGKYDPQNPNITAAYEDEEIEEYTPESWEEKWTLQPGTTLYHGTSTEWEEGGELAFPAWFSTNKKVANWFAHRSGEGTPIIRMYRVSNPYELVVLNDARDIQGFRDMYNIEDGGDPNALAEGVINAGFEGWIIPNNYRPGDDIMLGDGSGLEYMEQHPADAKSSDFFATGSVLAAKEKSVGDLGLARKVMHELMPVLGVQLPEPELKIVNSPRSGFLGQDVWSIGIDQVRGIYGGDNTAIHLQRSILNDENTLRRILAHELAHHADNLVNGPKLIEKWQGRDKVHYNMFRNELHRTGHGKGWKEYAQKFNAKYGADFVTEKSDESYVTEELPIKQYYILLKRDYDGKLAYEASSRISPKMRRHLDRMAQDKDETEYRLTQVDDRDFFNGHLIGSFAWSRPKEEEKQKRLEEIWAKAQKVLPSGAAKEQDDLLKLMRERMTGPGWQRPGRRASLLQKMAIPQIEQLERPVSKDYDRVAYVYNQMYSAQKPSLSWKDFQKMFPREQNSPLFTQIRQNRPQITLADLDRWLEEYKEKSKEYQNYNLEHSTYKDKATSFRDVEQLVLRINQSASAAEIVGEDEMLQFFLQQAEQGSRQSGHPVGKNTVGWLRVDFVNDDWLLIDEVQSDLINAVELAMKFISEPSLESLMKGYKSETVKQKIRDMGATEQMFQHSKREFNRRGYTMERLQEMKQSLVNLFKDWAEYGISSIIEIARRHGIKNVAIHTGTTIAKRDPDLEADKAVMYYDNLAKSFGFKKQQLDIGEINGEFWTRTASKTAGKRDEAATSLTFGVDEVGFPSPVLVRWEQGMRWREVLKAVKAIAGEIAERRVPWSDIHIWASLWKDRQSQEDGWIAEKSKGRVMYDVLHNGSYVRVDAAQPVAMGAEIVEASHKTPPLSDTRYNNPAQGEETNAYADIPERVRGTEELPALETLAPQMFEKESGERGPVPEGTTFRTEVLDAPRGQIDAQAQAWLNGERIGYVNFAVTEVDTELDDTRYWRKQQDEYGADEWERIAEIPQQAWVKYVYVHPDYRRMGIATGMYEQIKTDYPGVKITSSGTTDEGGKMRQKMKERGMFASALLQKKAVYGEAQNQVQHTDHAPVGMYKILKSNPFADEIEALRMSEGEEKPELNPGLPENRKSEGQPQAKGEDRIGEKMKDNGGTAGNVGRTSSKRARMVGPVYHGTSANFEKYESIYKLYYFTDDSEYAHEFLSRTQPGTMPEGSNIRRAYLRMEKPFDARSLPDELSVGELWEIIGGEEGQRTIKDTMQILPFWKWLRNYSKQIKAELERQGYDGIIQDETLYIPAGDSGGPGATSYVVFDPSQIKWTFGKEALKLTLDTPSGGLKAALDEINDRFPLNPMNSKEYMVLQGETPVAVFEVAGRNGKLRLKDIRSLEKGQGGGRVALQAVTAIADKHGVEMELTASPFGDEKTRLDKDQLQDWYRRHNFEDEPGHDPALGYMVRKPKKADNAELNRSGVKSVGFTQAVMRAGDTFIPTGTCDRCGTGIKNVFVVTYRDGSVQRYGSECINKILSNAPDMKSLFAKNAKLLKRYQDYLSILSGPAEAMPRGREYYGSGLYFIADSEGKDISLGHWFFHPIFDEEKNADHPRHVEKAEWIARCEKEIQRDIPKLKSEIARLEGFLGRILFKGMTTEPKKEAKQASNVISGEQVVDYVLSQHPGWDRQQAYQIVGLDAGGDYILTDEYDLDKLEAGDDYDPALAERYAKMKTPLPPIILDMDGKIRDGNHRVAAGKLRGDSYIAAYEPLDTYNPSEAG